MNIREISILLLALALLAVVASHHSDVVSTKSLREASSGSEVKEFYLRAEPGNWELMKGFSTPGWMYNGTVPGPELRVVEGDHVRIHVRNYLPVSTTIHWHGVELQNAMDGVPGLTQEAIEPGAEFTYDFIAYPAGTRIYHSHQDPASQMELGLYGALIIEPRHPQRHYDREYVAILDERAIDFTPDVALGKSHLEHEDSGNGRGGELQYDFFLINGKIGDSIPPIKIAKGERLLIRLINIGSLVHSMHLHGHTFTVVATDGNPVPPGAQLRKDTILIGPGERYDLEVEGDNPGLWLFHCHMPNHSENGMMTELAYEGVEPMVHPGMGSSETSDLVAVEGDKADVEMIDNHFSPANLKVKVGTTVTWTNHGTNRHTTTGSDALDWNSSLLGRDEKFSFTFTKPGTYHYICRQHLLNGMLGTIVVVN